MKALISSVRNKFYAQKMLVFINYKSINGPYGGGNAFVKNLSLFLGNLGDVEVTYTLKKGIDVYLIIDIRKGENKKYDFDEIWKHKIKNKKGAIVVRINDSDITRENKSREKSIIDNIDKIDHFVFNSDFIRSYYLNKYPRLTDKPNKVIYNASNKQFFFPVAQRKLSPGKIKIVTHHWSDNIHKGYDFYAQLFNYCATANDMEFVFIGRKFNDKYLSQPNNIVVQGPFKDKELADKIRACDIYVSASVYDACPMHILEGLSCGLPVLYINEAGGAKDICEMSAKKTGEPFADFDDFLKKVKLIKENYNNYVTNIIENIDLYNSEKPYGEYDAFFRSLRQINL